MAKIDELRKLLEGKGSRVDQSYENIVLKAVSLWDELMELTDGDIRSVIEAPETNSSPIDTLSPRVDTLSPIVEKLIMHITDTIDSLRMLSEAQLDMEAHKKPETPKYDVEDF
jgi:hypothetical protein